MFLRQFAGCFAAHKKTAAPARELLQINSLAQPMGKQSPQAAYNISTCQSAGVSDGLNTLRYTCVAL